ncbi:MAG TPA: serine hydrolase, partial [Dehalococcoidia bacterium]|nr:serine hydrolase [Dehalococcoidia bacterium]
MTLQTLRTLLVDLAILTALSVTGWFMGAEFLADKAGPATPIRVSSQAESATQTSGRFVLPLSGLSPFGHFGGLVGRQVLVGRVSEVGEGFFIAETATGPATFTFNDQSTFLLRLRRGGRSNVIPGASVAVVAEAGGGGTLEARSILVLPAESRPTVQGPDLFAFGGGAAGSGDDGALDDRSEAESIEGDGSDGGVETGDESAAAGEDEDPRGDDELDEAAADGEAEVDELQEAGDEPRDETEDDPVDEDGPEASPPADDPAPTTQSQPTEDGDQDSGVDLSGLLAVGEAGRLGPFELRLFLVVVSTGPTPALSGQLSVTNVSGSAATTPPLVAVCRQGTEVDAPSEYRAGLTLPASTLLTGPIRFALPVGCGVAAVEARAGGEELGWRITPPDRLEAVPVPEQPEALGTVLDEERRRYRLTGTSLAVAAPELDLWSGGSGLADRRADRPMDGDSVFRIGDLTHMFVAMAALQLVDEGVLELDAPLGEAFPSVPKSDRMTLRQLLNHTSGLNSFKIRPFVTAFFGDQTQLWAPAGVLSFLTPLNVDKPGEGWDHSGTNYLLVADLIEQVTGVPIEEEVQRRLLDPLGLTATGWIDRESPPAALVAAYSRLGTHEISQETYTALETGFRPAWGMVSSAADMARWMRTLGSGELLSSATLAATRDFVKGPGDIEAGLGIYAFRNDYGPGLGYRESG